MIGIGPGRGTKTVIAAARDRWTVGRVASLPVADVQVWLPTPLTRLVLDARLPPATRDVLGRLVEPAKRLTVEPDGDAPLSDDKTLTSWRVQAALALRELLREGLVLPDVKGLGDQVVSLRTIRGDKGKLMVVPAVLPLVDAVLLTLHPLLKKLRGHNVRFSGMTGSGDEEHLPGQPNGPGGHSGFAVRGCACMSCAMHRLLERQAKRDRAREMVYANEPMIAGSVQFGGSATSELIHLLTGGLGR